MPARWTWTGRVLFLLLAVESLVGELLDPCGSIVPEAPVVPLGANLTAVCVLKEQLRPNPPHNLSVSSSEELSSILKLTWVNPSITSFMRLKYDIQYRTRGASAWTQIPPEDTASTRSSFTVQDLRPFTEHVFRVRCMKDDGRGYWSAWSEEASGTTCEDRSRSTSGRTSPTLRRATLPSGPLTRRRGTTSAPRSRCARTAASPT
ncbi:interleukin 6 signal transducer [Phyllostomus discolor]|uniref:Interleukin 6 signal transducer n=1 Tax=Phyllostomus discolor TaxID=89673 RepID=A0A834EPH1_9CHIR|nr:interleukin 6 signal transducer [Phyllostomus discolor]